ncbi:MAG: hypothetical protein HYS25_13900 [Ignavibacteriales bacterium]|nr:hypothetical protein [Ignavibacteriales bacterium]
MISYLINKKNKKEAVVLPIDHYNKLLKELYRIKKRNEELEDELDIKLARKALKEKERIDFILKNYV